MSASLHTWRKVKNGVALSLSIAAALFGLMWLVWILWTTITKGMDSLSLDLFTQMTPPPNEPGGLANALFGSVVISLLAIALGTPIGIAAGTYLAEYANKHWLGGTVRFVNDILLSAPSIVLGLFIYTVMVAQMGHYSAWAGAVALAFIALPVIVRTTDEMLRLVPLQMREAALSLGVPQWKVTTQVLMRSALPGIVTGILLALARISGETAPLLFTAFNNQFWSTDLNQSMANLPMVIFQYAMSPYDSWNSLAWAGAFLVTGILLALARISGETAPLLFTAFNNQFWSTDLNQSMANLPMVIFQYAMSPYDSWNSLAWAGAFLVTGMVLVLSLIARTILLRNKVTHE